MLLPVWLALFVLSLAETGASYNERDFDCRPKGARIPTTSVCDGVLDCKRDGDFSDENETICAPAPYLKKDVSLVVSEVTNTSLVLSWSKATTKVSSHSLELAGYFVTARSEAHLFQNTVSQGLRTHQVQGLKPWSQYTLITRPFYTGSGKPESSYKVGRAASVFVTTLPSAPGAPGLVSVLSAQQRNVALNIVGPSLWNSDALGFHVRWEPTGQGRGPSEELDVSLDENWSLEKNSLNATLPLQGGWNYRVYVSAVGAGTSGATLKSPELEVEISVPLAPHYQPKGQWVTCYGAAIPPNVVSGGADKGEAVLVGRAMHSGDLLPGTVLRSRGMCSVSYGHFEYRHAKYQVLVSDGTEFDWILSSKGSVPSGAIQGGRTQTGERLYIGRILHNGTVIIGKVHPSLKCLYIPYEGKELKYTEYEVLVSKSVNFPASAR